MHLIDFLSHSMCCFFKRNFQGVQCEFMEVAMNYFSLFLTFLFCVRRKKFPLTWKCLVFQNLLILLTLYSVQNVQKIRQSDAKKWIDMKEICSLQIISLKRHHNNTYRTSKLSTIWWRCYSWRARQVNWFYTKFIFNRKFSSF